MGKEEDLNFHKKLMDDLHKQTDSIKANMDRVMGLFPKSAPKKVTIDGKEAQIMMVMDGRLIVEFKDKSDCEKFFNESK
jgi:hypothetical protein